MSPIELFWTAKKSPNGKREWKSKMKLFLCTGTAVTTAINMKGGVSLLSDKASPTHQICYSSNSDTLARMEFESKIVLAHWDWEGGSN